MKCKRVKTATIAKTKIIRFKRAERLKVKNLQRNMNITTMPIYSHRSFIIPIFVSFGRIYKFAAAFRGCFSCYLEHLLLMCLWVCVLSPADYNHSGSSRPHLPANHPWLSSIAFRKLWTRYISSILYSLTFIKRNSKAKDVWHREKKRTAFDVSVQ